VNAISFIGVVLVIARWKRPPHKWVVPVETIRQGVHLGAMAGTVDLMQRVSTGIEITGDVLRLNPRLPQEMERLDMRIRYRGHSLDLRLTPRHAYGARARTRRGAHQSWIRWRGVRVRRRQHACLQARE